MKRNAFKILALVVSLSLVLSLAEGIYSYATDRSLIRKLGWLRSATDFPAPLGSLPDQVRIEAGSLTEGAYATPLDPEIGAQMKGEFTYEYHRVECHTDALGLRRRVGPPPVESAQRIVILGDSVAFGFGVEDDETFAHQLEELLTAALPEGSVRPVVLTAAAPGWTTRNSKRFLLDHLEEIAPDEVIFIPVGNDLDDSFSTLETGHRATHLDPAKGSSTPHRSYQYHFALRNDLRKSGNGAFERSIASHPERQYALYSGVSPESRRRFGETIDDLEELDRRLESHGAGFTVAYQARAQPYTRRLLHALAERGSSLECMGMIARIAPEDTLIGNPHLNARAIRAGAHRIATHLIANGRISEAVLGELPAIDERYRDNQFGDIDLDELRQEKAIWDKNILPGIGPRIDLARAERLHQIYGGIRWDGSMGIAFHLLLRSSAAKTIELNWARHAGPDGLYPMTLEIEIGGVIAGQVEIGASGEESGVSRIPIPTAGRQEDWIEVIGRASNWYVQRTKGYSRLVSMTLNSIAAVE